MLCITRDLVEDIIVHYTYDWEAESNTLLVLCIYSHIDPIWLYNIGCSTGDEVLEDCSRLNWGSYSRYCSHSDDVGVICKPSEIEHLLMRDYPSAVHA